jgi:hypothetical protein
MKKRPWATSIDELVRSFRDAICALIPVAERVQMHWREPDVYDDWDRICDAIYRSIVIDSIEHARGIAAFAPVSAYDHRISSYEKNSFIGNFYSKGKLAFVCFETDVLPFDRSLFAVLDGNFTVAGYSRIPSEEVKFIFCSKDRESGNLGFHDAIGVLL